MSRFIDLTNKKIGRWTVIERVENHKSGKSQFLCKCDCGTIKIIRSDILRNETTHSCGCFRREKARCQEAKHGMTNTPLYRRWRNMYGRCYNPNNRRYKNYGGRGIKICDEWLDKEKGFINFYNWAINNGYKQELTIDRIDVHGDYEPNNCRWVTNLEQQRNRTNNTFITYKGERHCISEWSELLNIPRHKVKEVIRNEYICRKQKNSRII